MCIDLDQNILLLIKHNWLSFQTSDKITNCWQTDCGVFVAVQQVWNNQIFQWMKSIIQNEE